MTVSETKELFFHAPEGEGSTKELSCSTEMKLPKDGEVTIANKKDLVWAPFSALYFLDILADNNIPEQLKNATVLDLGTGSGIFAVAACRWGAEHIDMTDINDAAVDLARQNMIDNGIPTHSFDVIKSNKFESIDPHKLYDAILSNPPVQPATRNIHVDNQARKFNESGKDGREVLDSLLLEGRQHLNDNGSLFFCSSSRHGHRQTCALLDQEWGVDSWRVLNYDHFGQAGVDNKIDPEYHGPYMPIWIDQQLKDFDLRVYQRDPNGKPYFLSFNEDGENVVLTTTSIDNVDTPIKTVINADNQITKAFVFDTATKSTQEISLPSTFELPQFAPTTDFYFRYYVIEAKKIAN